MVGTSLYMDAAKTWCIFSLCKKLILQKSADLMTTYRHTDSHFWQLWTFHNIITFSRFLAWYCSPCQHVHGRRRLYHDATGFRWKTIGSTNEPCLTCKFVQLNTSNTLQVKLNLLIIYTLSGLILKSLPSVIAIDSIFSEQHLHTSALYKRTFVNLI